MSESLYDTDAEEAPSPERLESMISALKNGKPLSNPVRAEIAKALGGLQARHANVKKKKAGGRGISYSAWLAAALVDELISRGLTGSVYEACAASKKSVECMRGRDATAVSVKDINAVKRNYEKLLLSADRYMPLAGGGKFKVVSLSEHFINDAAVRLQKGMADLGSGASPSLMGGVIVLLTDPIPETRH